MNAIKRLQSKTWARTLAFLLCVTLATAALLSAWATLHARNAGWYSENPTFASSSACRSALTNDSVQVQCCLGEFGLPRSNAELKQALSGWDITPGLCVQLRDDRGRVLCSTFPADRSELTVVDDSLYLHLTPRQTATAEQLPADSADTAAADTDGAADTNAADDVDGGADTDDAVTVPDDTPQRVQLVLALSPEAMSRPPYLLAKNCFERNCRLLPVYLPAGIGCGLLALLLLVFLLNVPRHPFPLDGLLALLILPFIFGWGILIEPSWAYAYSSRSRLWLAAGGTAGGLLLWLACGSILLLQIVANVRQRGLFSRLLVVRGGRALLSLLPGRWKLIGGYLVYMLVLLYLVLAREELAFMLAVILVLAGLILLLYLARQSQKLQAQAEALAAGKAAPCPAGMWGSWLRHGQTLAQAANAVERAAEARSKSERLRSELITNVSHDLKTPLTSIVTYLDLLQKAEPRSREATEYLAVLQRQSERLKRLTAQVVEAAKAASGSQPWQRERLAVAELLTQLNGEYAERMQAAGLELVVRDATADLLIQADGALLARIFDNLLGNALKYAQPGTRVYLQAEALTDRALLSVKNISREPLNISADELLERFVRGDASRSTDGCGLGLAIASSLAQLMQGQLTLAIDGDLFKAALALPIWSGTGTSTGTDAVDAVDATLAPSADVDPSVGEDTASDADLSAT